MRNALQWNEMLVTVSRVRKFKQFKETIDTLFIKKRLTLKQMSTDAVSLTTSPTINRTLVLTHSVFDRSNESTMSSLNLKLINRLCRSLR
jgi:hypothetical protein